jgi:hypothetical protein
MRSVLKKIIPRKFWAYLRTSYYSIVFQNRQRVFCISMQRNGTTSVGNFLKDHGFRVCGYSEKANEWSELWLKGEYESIFKNREFKSFEAFEDNPWWFPDFYRVLNSHFPNSKFILLYRDPDKWFDSMVRHPDIKHLTNHYIHNKIYRKLDLFYDKLDNDPSFKPDLYNEESKIPFETMREHYKKIYEEYNRDAIEYFKKYAPEKLFYTNLEQDDEKWKKLGKFLGVKVNSEYNTHIKSPV